MKFSKKGDRGFTSLIGGQRISKSGPSGRPCACFKKKSSPPWRYFGSSTGSQTYSLLWPGMKKARENHAPFSPERNKDNH
jgi:hypothetical protein